MEQKNTIKSPKQSFPIFLNNKKRLRAKASSSIEKLEAEKSREERIKRCGENIERILNNEKYKHRNWAKELSEMTEIMTDHSLLFKKDNDPAKTIEDIKLSIINMQKQLNLNSKTINNCIHFMNKMNKLSGKNIDDIKAAKEIIPDILEEMCLEHNHVSSEQKGILYRNPANGAVIGEEIGRFNEQTSDKHIFTNPQLNPKGFRPLFDRETNNKNPVSIIRNSYFRIYDENAIIKKKRKKDHESTDINS